MSFWSKLSGFVLVVLIGVLASVLLVLSQANRLQQAVEQFPIGATPISLQGVSEEGAASVLAALGEFADGDGRAIVRVDPQSAGNEGGITGMRIGVAANREAPPPELELTSLGTTLFDTDAIIALLSGEPEASLGLDINSADVISAIPEFAFAPRITVVQLPHQLDTSGTANGTYRVLGATADEVTGLLAALESVTGQSAESMRTPMQGQSTSGGLIGSILLGFLIAATVLLLLLLMFETLRAFRVLGVHLLLGKSVWGFSAALFRPMRLAAAVSAILAVFVTISLAPGYQVTPELLSLAWAAAAAGAALTLVCVAIAASALILTKPVNAILGRYSRRKLLRVVSVFYLTAMAACALTLIFLDGPIREANRLADVARSWAVVEDQQILYRMGAGNFQVDAGGRSAQQTESFYTWYDSIADKPGVSLIKTEFYTREILDQWGGSDAAVPEQPFWHFVASPSWLAAQSFPVNSDLIARAKAGERVFLIPDSWPESTSEAMRTWLDADSRPSYEPAIRTEYFENQVVRFEGYTPSQPLFTWSPDMDLPQSITDPVILISTPQNMVPFESESLPAVGLDNGYIKLSAAAAAEYTTGDYLAGFGLADSGVEFLPVSDFIAGLTKSIETVVQLFAGVVLFLVVFCLVALVSLTRLFATTYRESLAVKRMLGFSLTRLFVPALALIGGGTFLAIVLALAFQSASALWGGLILLVLQAVLMAMLARHYARLHLSTTLTE
ncbi:hypothetical protein D9V32_09610 [Mycetocola tolaasinivorans]|uniref:DUF1430 domain-containing protein n=1 Tax=Mycetocola tolaasinivorans TaxID=76635 RepID=A0A3L7A7Y5_9MICO|nr:hypothetical protein [Mycetocola tolaasinivorans]RLP75711.1 hypothetical protein D9V32_09610 [Mycetocola tolaasinivorans]